MPPHDEAPEVHIADGRAGPAPILEVETALPIFIGYTSHAARSEEGDLILKPTLVASLGEYDHLFGGAPLDPIAVTLTTAANGGYLVSAISIDAVGAADAAPPAHLLRHSVEMFFANGGHRCYVLSVGGYQDPPNVALRGGGAAAQIANRYGLLDGLEAAADETGPTLLVIPEAVKLSEHEYGALVQEMLSQCGDLRDRFAILDLYHGGGAKNGGQGGTAHSLTSDRALLGANHLMYGACYYPFLRTALTPPIAGDESNVTVTFPGGTSPLGSLRETHPAAHASVTEALRRVHVILPPSGAVAGVIAATDRARGVWKAPANVGLTRVVEPVLSISSPLQEVLNVDPVTGKSINAIRTFPGRGTLVWGARTLAGNDDEWRYVNVRRFLTIVEVSVGVSTRWAAFEPNEEGTWARVRGAIENYLTGLWHRGALTGTTQRDAFFVRCGMGTTMTGQDILQGRLIIEMGLAVVRPAEFIIIRIVQHVQQSNATPPHPITAKPPPLTMHTERPSPAFAVGLGDETVGFVEASGLRAGGRGDHRTPVPGRRPRIGLPGIAKSANVTLKRGIATRDGTFARWLRGTSDRAERRDLTITMLDERQRIVGVWTLRNARPVKVVGPSLNASGNEVAIDSVEIAHEGVEIETI